MFKIKSYLLLSLVIQGSLFGAQAGHDIAAEPQAGEIGYCIRTLEGHSNWVSSVVFSPDGTQLASGSGDKKVRLFNPETGALITTLGNLNQIHSNSVYSVVFSPDGTRVASGSSDTKIKLWNPETGECTKTLKGNERTVTSVAFSPNGEKLASGSNDNTVKLWSLVSYYKPKIPNTDPKLVAAVKASFGRTI